MVRGRLGFRLVLAGAMLGALATSPLAAQGRFPPELDHRLIEELRAGRFDGGSEPLRALPWPDWRESSTRCAERDIFRRVLDGLVEDQICAPVFEDVKKITWLVIAELDPFGAVPQPTLARLDGMAAVADLPDAAFQCTAKLLVRLGPEVAVGFVGAQLADRLRTDPTTLRKIDAAIDKVFDLKSLYDFAKNLRKIWTEGAQALGDAPQEAPGEGWKMVGEVEKIPGWFEGFRDALETFHPMKVAGLTGRRAGARRLLDTCAPDEAALAHRDLLAESRAYTRDLRDFVVWAEQEIYCTLPAPSQGDPRALDVAGWIATSDRFGQLRTARDQHREIAQFEAEVAADSRFGDRALEDLRGRAERAHQIALRYRDLASLPTAELACSDSKLAVDLRDACFERALTRLGASFQPHHVERRLEHLAEGRRTVAVAVEHGASAAAPLIERCRGSAARDAFAAALREVDAQLGALAALSTADFRHCFSPWPGDEIERRIAERERTVASARSDATTATAAAAGHDARCAWVEAQTALDAARSALDDAGCDDAAFVAERGAIASAEQRLRDRREPIERLRTEAEQRRRDLAYAAEVAVHESATGELAARCAALPRARQVIAELAAFSDPTALECVGSSRSPDGAGELEAGLRGALAELSANLEELVASARSAAAACDLAALDSRLAELTSLPAGCPGEPRALLPTLESRRNEIERDRDHVRRITPLLGAEWQAAYERCDLVELAAVRNRVSIVRQNWCAWENLTRAERADLEELAGRTRGLGELAARVEALAAGGAGAGADLPAACLDRLPQRPDAGGDSSAATAEWVGGAVESVSSGGGPAAGSAGAPNSGGMLDTIVALGSPEQCRYVEALALAERAAAELAPDTVEGRWLAGQLPELRRLALDQRIAAGALAQALEAARRDDPRAARSALKLAKRRALDCQVDPIDRVDEQLARAEEADRRADRAAFADAMSGLLPRLVDVYNRGVAAQSPPPQPVRTSGGTGGGCDDPVAARTLFSGLDGLAGRVRCSCAGYEFDSRQGGCLRAASAERNESTGGEAASTGGDWAIVRVDRRWSETAAFCGGAAQVAVKDRNVTLYVRGPADSTVAGWQAALAREDVRPGAWVKSGPCTCRRAGSGSVSIHRGNLSQAEAQAIWEREIRKLPGTEVDFGVWEVLNSGDGAGSAVATSQVCSLLG